MEQLCAKMGEFVKMETELPFPDFQAYYQEVMDYLQKNYQDMTDEQLVQAKGITMIMGSNANMRSLRKDENRKKFQKMAQKSNFWENAIKLRLTKAGMTEQELDEKVGALWTDTAADEAE